MSWKTEVILRFMHQALDQGHTVHIINATKNSGPVIWQYPDPQQLALYRPNRHRQYATLQEMDADLARQTQCWTCDNPCRVHGYCRDCWDLHVGGPL